ncbi:hydrogenase transcriptional regulatory protein hupR1 [mine drainage metagenome]|uniref:Hydrogenase transcriptional regulatory protein hupR1 n=1 Tax=mine drainage metagenome TaxID=410659 RepID=A0A1J5QWP7_9ZZZZ
MEETVLLVDDDANLLAALQRQLRKSYNLHIAEGAEPALAAITAANARQEPFAVVVCDMRMPDMDGIEVLSRIKTLSPDTVRIMLTGNADQQTAIAAINTGNIFRFLSKPCSPETLVEGLEAALIQYRLITAERDLLEKTLSGVIKVLADVMSINDPMASALAIRLRDWVRTLTTEFKLPMRWQLDIAAALMPIGMMSIEPGLILRKNSGQPLTDAERQIFERAPAAGRDLIINIPRLAKVAEIIYLQDRGFDGSGFPPDGPVGAHIPFDARLLKVLKDLAEATHGGPPTAAAFAQLGQHQEQYDPQLLSKIRSCLEAKGEVVSDAATNEVPVAELRVGAILLSDLRLENGHLILQANTRLSETHIGRVRNLRRIFSFIEPVRIQTGP